MTECIDHKQYGEKRLHGLKWYRGSVVGYHVYTYCIADGKDPRSLKGTGLVVMHKCDNPRCINPEHLELGTPKQNTRDAVKRLGASVGINNGASKLTLQDVESIRKRYAAGGISQRALAKEFGVAQSQIWRVTSGEGWN